MLSAWRAFVIAGPGWYPSASKGWPRPVFTRISVPYDGSLGMARPGPPRPPHYCILQYPTSGRLIWNRARFGG